MSRTRRFVQKLPVKALLAAPFFLYMAVTIFWQARGIYKITGDEPHYLVIADSIVRDRDLLVENNYSADTAVQRATSLKLSDPAMLGPHIHNQFSLHNPGLPVLLAPSYYLAGVPGAKIFMALLAALWPFLLYRTLLEVIESKHWSALLAFTFSVGLPFSAASNQIYPDLLAGLLILYLAARVFRMLGGNNEAAPSSAAAHAGVGLLLAFLPWLHIRLSAPALLLLLAYLYALAYRLPDSGARPARRLYLIPAAALVFSLIMLAAYNRLAFQSPFGPYGEHSMTFNPRAIVMIFLGLHFDQMQGMFIQQPLLMLGLLGAGLLAGANRRGALMLAALYLSLLLPAAMHPAWYGGGSFAGRFWWGAAPLWIIPAAYSVRFLLKRKELTLLLICAGALIYQAWLAAGWLFHDNFLIYGQVPVWAARGFFEHTGLLLRLPTFRDFHLYTSHPSNYVFLLFGLLMLATGWLWRRGTFRLSREIWVWVAVMGICVVAFAPPVISPWMIEANELNSQVGSVEATHRVAVEKDGPGALAYGPYAALPWGDYKVRLEYEYNSQPGAPAPHFDVVYSPGAKTVADAELPPSAESGGVFEHRFTVREDQSLSSLYEFRVFYTGRGQLAVKRVTLAPVSLYTEY